MTGNLKVNDAHQAPICAALHGTVYADCAGWEAQLTDAYRDVYQQLRADAIALAKAMLDARMAHDL